MKNVIVNNNRNTAEDLINEVKSAYEAIRNAQDAVRKMTIHGRNYQTAINPQTSYNLDFKDKQKALQELENVAEWLVDSARNLRS